MSTNAAVTGQALPPEPELAGKIVRPGDERFGEARAARNLAVDQRPAAVVFPESAEDVRATVRLTAAQGLRIAAQGTGHLAGPLGSPVQAPPRPTGWLARLRRPREQKGTA